MKLKFDRNQLAAVLAATPAAADQLHLVKDDGIYIMSCAEKRPASVPETDKDWTRTVAYARGYNPKVDDADDVWEKSRNAMGGDDGADVIGTREEFQKILDDSEGDIIVSVTASTLSTSYLPKMTPEAKAARIKGIEDWLKKTTEFPEDKWSPKFKATVKKMRKELESLKPCAAVA